MTTHLQVIDHFVHSPERSARTGHVLSECPHNAVCASPVSKDVDGSCAEGRRVRKYSGSGRDMEAGEGGRLEPNMKPMITPTATELLVSSIHWPLEAGTVPKLTASHHGAHLYWICRQLGFGGSGACFACLLLARVRFWHRVMAITYTYQKPKEPAAHHGLMASAASRLGNCLRVAAMARRVRGGSLD